MDAETLAGYWEAARGRSRELLDSLQDSDVDTKTPARPGGSAREETYKITVARVTGDTSQHIGQIAYVRGLVDRQGWYGS